MRRKILMGVLAVALPVGTLTALTSAAQAKAVTNPVSCTGFSGTVTFGTPITANGVPTTSHSGNPTTISGGTFTCSGGTAPNTGGVGSDGAGLTIKGGKNLKSTTYSKSACKANPGNAADCDKYNEGSQAAFAASGGSLVKSLGAIAFTIGGQPATFKGKGVASEDIGPPCPGEVGFTIPGQVKGAYGTKAASITACLGHDSGPGTTNSFGVDLFSPTAEVITAQIDGAISVATL